MGKCFICPDPILISGGKNKSSLHFRLNSILKNMTLKLFFFVC